MGSRKASNMGLNIQELAKKHLYTVEGSPFWEAAGHEEFAEEIIEECAKVVDHISMSGGGTIGNLIRRKFDLGEN